MANLKRFTLKDDWKDWDIVLEVDLDQLTIERATEINQFWGGDDDRLAEADGDVVRAVIKHAAKRLVYALLEQGGEVVRDGEQSQIWTQQDLHNQEGWGGTDDGNPFGWCGIRLVRADVLVDLDLEFQEA